MMNDIYHDWILLSINVRWAEKTVSISLDDGNIVARDVERLTVPMNDAWGPSSYVNGVVGPVGDGEHRVLTIEMQSGDVIEVHARSFELPSDRYNPERARTQLKMG